MGLRKRHTYITPLKHAFLEYLLTYWLSGVYHFPNISKISWYSPSKKTKTIAFPSLKETTTIGSCTFGHSHFLPFSGLAYPRDPPLFGRPVHWPWTFGKQVRPSLKEYCTYRLWNVTLDRFSKIKTWSQKWKLGEVLLYMYFRMDTKLCKVWSWDQTW